MTTGGTNQELMGSAFRISRRRSKSRDLLRAVRVQVPPFGFLLLERRMSQSSQARLRLGRARLELPAEAHERLVVKMRRYRRPCVSIALRGAAAKIGNRHL